MKLALVIPGGVDRTLEFRAIPCLVWLVERLARRHEVHVFQVRHDPRPDHHQLLGATIHNAGAAPAALRTLGMLLAEHRRGPFDLIHAFWLAWPGVIAGAAGRLLRRPVLIHAAGGELVALPDIGYGWQIELRRRLLVKFALASATRVTAASRPIARQVAEAGWVAERVPLGVDLGRWPARPPRARTPGVPARLLHVASLNRVKDQVMLLRAAARLAALGVGYRLDIVGMDTLHGEMETLAGRLGLAARVRFHGFLPHSRLRPLMEAADLLWLSSRHEAGPLVVLEAAVAGVPCVGTAVGHLAEWAPDAALAVPVGDSEALAGATAALLADDDRRLRLAREAQRRAVAEDADWTAARFEAIYAGLTVPAAPSS